MSWLKGLLIVWIIVSGISFIILWRLLYVQSQEAARHRKMQTMRNLRMQVRMTMVEEELGIKVSKLPGGDVPLIVLRGRG